jgi:glucose-6-phosphate isomerase
MKIVNPKAFISDKNIIEGDVKHYEKNFSDIKNLYFNSEGYSDTLTMYDVYSYENEKENCMSLNYGLTVLHPVYINNECNFTRGHFHENLACAEIYVGSEGEGLLLLMDEDDNITAENIFPGSIHFINGLLAHRLVNTGDSDLKVYATWSPKAGHDYAKVENHPFKYRIYKIDNEIIFKEK